MSTFHPVLKRYEIFITPKVSTFNGVLTITCYETNIKGSPFAVTIVSGPYSLADSDWVEWNNDGVSQCLVNVVCSIKIVIRDKEKNLVTIKNMLRDIDVDTTMIGPYSYRHDPETLYISTIDSTESGSAVYYIYYKRIYVGKYFIYIRIRDERAPIYPLIITIYTTVVSPSNSNMISSDYKVQTAGIPFKFDVQVNDIFDNYVDTGLATFR